MFHNFDEAKDEAASVPFGCVEMSNTTFEEALNSLSGDIPNICPLSRNCLALLVRMRLWPHHLEPVPLNVR